MPDDKVKFYKNKNRGKVEAHKSYVPQYQLMGIEPVPVKNSTGLSVLPAKPIPEMDNPRTRQTGIRQLYPDPNSFTKTLVPNVGNNMDHTWSSINEEVVDDISDLDPNHPMIDNNEYVSLDTSEISTPSTNVDTQSSDFKFSALSEGDYLLIIDNSPFCAGSLNDVQEQARTLVFEDGISVDSLLIMKRVPIKMGLFLE